MKKSILILLLITSINNFSQIVKVNGNLLLLEKTDITENKEITEKKYLYKNYKNVLFNDGNKHHPVRYNIFNDEVEFLKGNNIYNLNKKLGDKITFVQSREILRVFDLNGTLNFFKVNLEGTNSVISKLIVKFREARKPINGYDKGTPAKYSRKKDVVYIAFNNNNLVKIPKKKKKFHLLFEKHKDEIKKYMKKEKLSHKNMKDLKKIITYYNSL